MENSKKAKAVLVALREAGLSGNVAERDRLLNENAKGPDRVSRMSGCAAFAAGRKALDADRNLTRSVVDLIASGDLNAAKKLVREA